MGGIFDKDFLVYSGDYGEVMNGTVIPWLSARERKQDVAGCDGHPLYCVSYDADEPIGTVMILHGFTENAFKYAELIWSLLHKRFSVIAYDQRGHGRSWREDGISDPSVTHVSRFTDYVEDLRIVTEACASSMARPLFLFAHSMGGAVASLFLEKYPDVFSAAVLSSPMIAPNLGGFPVFLASFIARSACMLGKQKSYPFFMKPYSGPEDFATSCATDPARFAWYDAVKYARTEFRNSVPSYRWSYESVHVTEKILAKGEPEKISCPVLLFSAETDSSVLPGPQKELAGRIPGCRQVLVHGARHEIYRSTYEVLSPWWHDVIEFLAAGTEGGVRE